MQTRCKPGDIAVIIQEERWCQSNIGRFVCVRGPIANSRHGPTWLIWPLNAPFHLHVRKNRTVVAYTDPGDIEHPDAWMLPIHDEELKQVIQKLEAVEA